MAYKYTNKTELEVNNACVDILNYDEFDLFDLGRDKKAISYDNQAEGYSRGIVTNSYAIILSKASKNFAPKNKKLAKLINDFYEDIYYYIYLDCEFSIIDNGVKLTVSMIICDPYDTFLVTMILMMKHKFMIKFMIVFMLQQNNFN